MRGTPAQKKNRVTMQFKHMCSSVWIMCAIATLSASPIPATSGVAIFGSPEGTSGRWPIEDHGRRKRRQLSTSVWNGDFLLNLGQSFANAVGRIRGIVGNGVTASPAASPLVQMVNDFRTRIAPIILRSVYTGTVQNIWDQILKQARTTINSLLDGTAES